MIEPIWTREFILDEAKSLASRSGTQLDIKHFWAIADRDLGYDVVAGKPVILTVEQLIARAKNYIKLDRTIVNAAVDPTNVDVAAAIKRTKVFDEHVEELKGVSVEFQTAKFLQFMCLTNLMFLGREVLNKLFTFGTHQPVCDFFIQKNPSLPLHEQDEVHEGLLLYPRGSYKSTVDIVDCAQWFINFPDARILILTAESGLAVEFIGELKNYFLVPKDARPTTFQSLFPEWTLSPNNLGAEDQFFCPKRTQGDEKKKDASAWASSILANLPGRHCDLLKGDDVVNDKNSETPQLVAKVVRKIAFAKSLVDPGGFTEFLGTPYASNDLYAKTESSASPGELRILKTPARWLRPESVHKDERDCSHADYELLFEFNKAGRKVLTHDFLDKRKREDLGIYLSQYMLNASGTRKIKFTMDLMLQRTISIEQLPHQLRYYIFWDFAYGTNTANDFSVGAVVGLDIENRGYVVEIFRDHYLDSDLAREIVASYQRYQPRLVSIENSNGAQFLEQTIRRYAEEAGIKYIPIDFFKVDKALNAKASRVGALQPRLLGGELFFLNTIQCLEDLYKEFKDFGTALHDDIPDAISHYTRILPSGISEPGGPGGKEKQEKFDKALREKDFYDMIFGQGDYAPVIPEAPIVPEPGTGDAAEDPIWDPYSHPGWRST
jgi:predicted phage terminase large subunit-like protein